MISKKWNVGIIILSGLVVVGGSRTAWAQDEGAVQSAVARTHHFSRSGLHATLAGTSRYSAPAPLAFVPSATMSSGPQGPPTGADDSMQAQKIQLLTDRIPSEADLEAGQPLSWFTVAPQVGYAFFPQAQMMSSGLKTTVSSRNALVAKMLIDFGGDGVGFEISPLFGVQTGGINNYGGTMGEVNTSLVNASFMNVGGEFAFLYTFHVGYFYPRVGIGFHGSYLFGDQIKAGAQLYGRVPVGFSIYLGKGIALVFEAAFLFGATGIVQGLKPTVAQSVLEEAGIESSAAASMSKDLSKVDSAKDLENFEEKYRDEIAYLMTHSSKDGGVDPDKIMSNAATNAAADAFRFGTGIALELTVGLRFP